MILQGIPRNSRESAGLAREPGPGQAEASEARQQPLHKTKHYARMPRLGARKGTIGGNRNYLYTSILLGF